MQPLLLRHLPSVLVPLALVWADAARAQASQAAEPEQLTIRAQASMDYDVPMGGTPASMASNVVHAITPVVTPWFAFFENTLYAKRVLTTRAGAALFPQIGASACNTDPHQAESLTVTLRAMLSNQVGTAVAVETAPNSGVFMLANTITTRNWSAGAPAADATLDVKPGDVIEASVSNCAGGTMSSSLRLDPRAFVFDMATGQPLRRTLVRLIDVRGTSNGGNAGGPAVLVEADGTTPAASTLMTDDEGGYSLPKLPAGRYRLVVEPAATHTFPSNRDDARVKGWAGSYPISGASFGDSFDVDGAIGSAVVNLPVDPLPRGLHVRKAASRATAEIAESIEYTISVKNVGRVDLARARLQDMLPPGFSYIAGSARLDGRAIADPDGGAGPRLRWPVAAALPVAAEHTLRYRVRIGTHALNGDGINRAQAGADVPGTSDGVISNLATAAVKVEAGVFSDRAFVLGTVFADCDADGLKAADEPGIPGVRLWLEDGSSVTTDSAGRYSLYGLTPRTHVLKLDPITLPEGATPLATAQRHAGDGASRFVDPRAGELQRADFALGGCSAAMRAAITARIESAAPGSDETSASLRTALTTTAAAATQDLRALPASGRIGETTAGAAGTAAVAVASAGTVNGPTSNAATATATASTSTASPSPTAFAAVPAAADDANAPLPRIVGLREGQVMPRSAAIRVAGHLGATMTLRVNGVVAGDDRIGERAQDSDAQIESRAYIGLPLKAGLNTLTLTEHDAFGQLRATRELQVAVPGELARIVVDAPARVEAGASLALQLRFEDDRGLPVVARLPVTLTAPGRWAAEDLDPRAPGVQTFVEGGVSTQGWSAPDAPGEARLRIAVDGVSAEARVAVVAALRPMMAVGLVDAAINLRRLKVGQVQPAGSGDGFESQLRAFAGGNRGGDATGKDGADARGAVFLKGKVRGDTLLTLAYDSDKSTRERLFRDIQPDAFYPVYGDASVKGYDAQSTGKLYVRIDRGQSSLLYGDFTTQSDDPVRQLGAYQRSLNGLKQHLQLGAVQANAFAARDTTRQAVVELRGNGTSGPYALAGDAVENSEKVELIVRDRDQPALIVRATPMTRFADYDFEPLTGRLLMRAPVPSVDADLNPVSLRVTYEIDQGGAAFWVAGADASWQATESLAVGGAVVKDWNPMAPMQMGSANAKLKLAEKTELSAEVARVSRGESIAEGTEARAGNAERLAFAHDGAALKVRAHAARSDVGFDNRSALINSGRSEGGAQATYMIDERTRLVGEALYTADARSGADRIGVLLGVERSLGNGAKVELGARHVVQHAGGQAGTDGANAGETTTVRAKVGIAVPGLPAATVYVEGEQDVRDAAKRLLAVGGDYQLSGGGRAYARHELISSLSGPYALDPSTRRNTTVIGVDGAAGLGGLIGGEGRTFSEYRGREAFSGRETEAAIGLRNQWTLRPGLRLNVSLERVQALQRAKAVGDAPVLDSDSTAVTGAVEYTADPRWKGTARLELRGAAGTTGVLSTLGLAYKLDERWTLLGKNVVAGTMNKGAVADRWQERLQLGTAFRDDAARVNALGRYEYKDERGTAVDAEQRRAHILSVHAEHQVDRALAVTGRYAAKMVSETVAGVRTRATAQLASVRVTRDIGERWDVGIAASVMGDARLRSRQAAIGVEAGYRVKDNLWVSVGYNVAGFKDRDLSADDATARGVYLRLRFKFDEKLLSGLAG